MYLSFYKLDQKPFQISTDPSFLWLGEKHKEALAILKYGILENKGVLLLTGDVGTGKTTLINALINSLGDEVIAAKVPDPGMELIDFMNYISHTFNMKKYFERKDSFLVHFGHFLNTAYVNGKKVLLIIDESQRLSSEMLEEVRQLSNIEKQTAKLLNIFFVGQNEFNDILQEDRNRALRQRITLNYVIDPLDVQETGEFIRHRLKVAGAKNEIFSSDAIQSVYEYSQGFPRRINIVCDHAMLLGFVQTKETITGEMVRECADELRLPESSEASESVSLVTDDGSVPDDISETEKATPLSNEEPEKASYVPDLPVSGSTNLWKPVGAFVLIAMVMIVLFFKNPTEEQQDVSEDIMGADITSQAVASENDSREPPQVEQLPDDNIKAVSVSSESVGDVVEPEIIVELARSDEGTETDGGGGNVVATTKEEIGAPPEDQLAGKGEAEGDIPAVEFSTNQALIEGEQEVQTDSSLTAAKPERQEDLISTVHVEPFSIVEEDGGEEGMQESPNDVVRMDDVVENQPVEQQPELVESVVQEIESEVPEAEQNKTMDELTKNIQAISESVPLQNPKPVISQEEAGEPEPGVVPDNDSQPTDTIVQEAQSTDTDLSIGSDLPEEVQDESEQVKPESVVISQLKEILKEERSGEVATQPSKPSQEVESTEKTEISIEEPEDMDPGAVIDWVLKNRSE